MLLMVLSSFIGSFGAVFLKTGASKLTRNLAVLMRNWQLVAGVALFLLSSYFFVLGVRKGQLSVLYPIVSLQYVWAMFWSRIFFGEPYTKQKFIGLAMILGGTLMVVMGKH